MGRLGSFAAGRYFALLSWLNTASLILIFFLAVWMCVEVVARTFFNQPIPGTPELVKSSLPAIVFLSLAYTLRHKRHVRVEIITQRLPPLGQEVVTFVGSLFGFIIFFIAAWYSWGPAWAGWLVREYEGVQFKVPVYPIRFISVLGAGLLSFQFLLDMLASFGALRSLRKRTD